MTTGSLLRRAANELKKLEHVVVLSSLNGINVCFMLATTVLALNALGATLYGQIIMLQAVSISVCAFIIPPSNYIIQGYGSASIVHSDSKARATKNLDLSEFWVSVDHYVVGVATLVTTIIYCFYFSDELGIFTISAIALGSSFNQMTACTGFLRTLELHTFIAISLIAQSATRLAMLLAVYFGLDINLFLIFLIPDIVRYSALLLIATLSTEFRFSFILNSNVVSTLEIRSLLWLMITKIIDLPMQVADKLFIGTYVGESAAAYVHVARRAWILLSLIPETAHQKYLSRILKSGRVYEKSLLFKVLFFSILYFLFGSLVCTLAFYTADSWVGFVLDSQAKEHYFSAFFVILFIGAFAASSILLHPVFLSICGARNNLIVMVIINSFYLCALALGSKTLNFFILCLAFQALLTVCIKMIMIAAKLTKSRKTN